MTTTTTVSREAVGAEVRAWMGRRRVSQVALARQLGISRTALRRRLIGELPFDLDELFAMSDYFGVDPSDLIKRSSPWTTVTELTPRKRTTANLESAPRAA